MKHTLIILFTFSNYSCRILFVDILFLGKVEPLLGKSHDAVNEKYVVHYFNSHVGKAYHFLVFSPKLGPRIFRICTSDVRTYFFGVRCGE